MSMKQERLVTLVVKMDYLDMKENRTIHQGEILHVTDKRAKEILAMGFADIVKIPKLVQ